MAKPRSVSGEPGLTRREIEVASLVTQGLTNRQIAAKLFISERTADGHLERIREKLGVGTRTQIATWYVARSSMGELGLVPQAANRWPPQPTSLLGRERELVELRHLMLRPAIRLLTLTGPPGTGKTRLAVRAALDLQHDFDDGAHFVDLSPIFDPTLVLSAIGQVVGAQPLLHALTTALRPKRTLVVLDNFEQILPAAGQVAELLASCPDLKLIVTSRECLHLFRWEHEYPVQPLQLPDVGDLPPVDLSKIPSVALFVDRALARNPRFVLSEDSAPTVAKICIRLDGLPLAIELAAARVKFQTPAAILSGLIGRGDEPLEGGADFPRRHQTLNGAIAASHDLLSSEELILFRRLSPFVGGFELDALEEVTADGNIAAGQVARILTKLVDKSLVQVDVQGKRFRTLETIRDYALDRLREAGELEAVNSRFSRYFVKLAEETRGTLHGPDEAGSFDRLQLEVDNFRAVLARALADRDLETGLRLGTALSRFWGWRGFAGEGRKLLAEFVGQAEETTQLEKVPAALRELAYLEGRQIGPRAARPYYERYLAMARRGGDHQGAAIALFYLGESFYLDESNWRDLDLTTCRNLLDEALREAQQCSYRPLIAYSLRALAMVSHMEHHESAADRLIAESLTIERELGDNRGVALGLLFRGRIAFDRGDHGVAAADFSESLRLYINGGYLWAIPDLLEWFARLAIVSDKPLIALRLAGAADALIQTIGVQDLPFWHQDFDQQVNALAGGDARRHPEWAAGQAVELEEAASLAYGVWDPVTSHRPPIQMEGSV